MKKPVKRIHIDGIEYTYVMGKNIVIRYPDRKIILTNMSKVSGWNWDNIERGLHKRYFSITPGMVKRWLELYLKTKADFSIYLRGWSKNVHA